MGRSRWPQRVGRSRLVPRDGISRLVPCTIVNIVQVLQSHRADTRASCQYDTIEGFVTKKVLKQLKKMLKTAQSDIRTILGEYAVGKKAVPPHLSAQCTEVGKQLLHDMVEMVDKLGEA